MNNLPVKTPKRSRSLPKRLNPDSFNEEAQESFNEEKSASKASKGEKKKKENFEVLQENQR